MSDRTLRAPHPRRRAVAIVLASLAFLLAAPPLSAAPGVYRDRVDAHWFADGKRFWYRNDLPGGARQFVFVDADRGTREPAFDHAKAAAKLAELTGKPVSADKLPVESLDYDDADGGAVKLVGRDGGGWRLDLASYELKPTTGAKPQSLVPLDRPRPSRASDVETSIAFENRTAADVDLFWVAPDGERRQYGGVKPGERREQHTFAGHVWLAADKDGRPIAAFEATARPADAIVGGKPGDAPRPAARRRPRGGGNADPAASSPRPRGPVSPDGKWRLIVRDANLVLVAAGDGAETPLSHDGKPGDGYDAGQVWWSPDASHVVAMRVEAGDGRKIQIVESSPKDQLQPKVRTIDYDKPGDKIDVSRPHLFRVASKEEVHFDEALFPNPWSVRDVRWSADSARFTFVYNQRGHQVLRVVAVDAATGKATAIVEEKSPTFIDYSGKYFCRWIGDDEILWMSERDGWNHLWLYDAKTGKVKNQVTKGEWVVQGIDRIDVATRQVWFRAGGVRPGQDPYFTHYCRANFDGTGFVILTEGDGTHAVEWSAERRFFIDTWSRVNQPPVTELRRGDDGRLVCKLEEADAAEALKARGGRWPEPRVAKGRDGKTDVFGVVYFPRDFDPAKKYPVLEQVYAGPQDFFTPKAFTVGHGVRQSMADRGFIVVQADGMGTSGRSKAFHDVCWKNLKDAGFPDRITWIKAAAAAHPQMDLARVGIYGGSAGGQNAMAALLWHHDFYSVAVADCGCHDNRMDKIWWNEQWMGWPVDKSYEDSSNVVNAKLLQGKLMLIVGELDDNVDPASTMQAANALQKANKDFDLLVITGAKHGAAETPYGSRRRADFLVKHLISPEAAKANGKP